MAVTRTLRGMAARSWAGSSITAVAIAAGAGAAQLGIGYGLGIVTWLPSPGSSLTRGDQVYRADSFACRIVVISSFKAPPP